MSSADPAVISSRAPDASSRRAIPSKARALAVFDLDSPTPRMECRQLLRRSRTTSTYGARRWRSAASSSKPSSSTTKDTINSAIVDAPFACGPGRRGACTSFRVRARVANVHQEIVMYHEGYRHDPGELAARGGQRGGLGRRVRRPGTLAWPSSNAALSAPADYVEPSSMRRGVSSTLSRYVDGRRGAIWAKWFGVRASSSRNPVDAGTARLSSRIGWTADRGRPRGLPRIPASRVETGRTTATARSVPSAPRSASRLRVSSPVRVQRPRRRLRFRLAGVPVSVTLP